MPRRRLAQHAAAAQAGAHSSSTRFRSLGLFHADLARFVVRAAGRAGRAASAGAAAWEADAAEASVAEGETAAQVDAAEVEAAEGGEAVEEGAAGAAVGGPERGSTLSPVRVACAGCPRLGGLVL